MIWAKITPCMENGKAAVAKGLRNGLGFGSTEFHVLRPDKGVLPEWLFHFVRQTSLRDLAKVHFSGAVGQQRVPASFLLGTRIPLAPTTEQHRIVAEIEQQFSRLDAAVAALKRAQANLRRYRASVLKAACEGRLVPQEPNDEPASELLKRVLAERRTKWEMQQLARMRANGTEPHGEEWRRAYRQPEPPDPTQRPLVPTGWAVASVDQLTSRITSGSRDWSRYYGRGSGTFLMAQNIRQGKLDLSFRQQVGPPPGHRDCERSEVQMGDNLVTIVGANTGDVCRVPTELPEHYVCQSVALVRPVLGQLSKFLYTYLVSPQNGQRQFQQYIYGQGRPHMSFDQLKVTSVALPPLAEQRRIVAEVERRLSVVDELEATVQANLKRAERLRRAILKRAFEGKLVPQDPNDEPAGVLLERIRAERQAGSPSPRKWRTTQLPLPLPAGGATP